MTLTGLWVSWLFVRYWEPSVMAVFAAKGPEYNPGFEDFSRSEIVLYGKNS
jgi:hypothetical protein